MRPARFLAAAAALALVCAACASGGAQAASPGADDTDAIPLRGASHPSEHAGLTQSVPVDADSFDAMTSKLFGADAAEGRFLAGEELSGGVVLSSEAHPDASDQAVWTVAMEVTTDAKPRRRTVARVPVGLDTGATFIAAVDAALAEHAKVRAEDPEATAPFRLEYRTTSAMGGSVVLAVDIDDERPQPAVLEVTATGPTTSLTDGNINTANFEGAPFESIYGLVWFGVRRDQFDFFVNRAYGLSAGKAQNFSDFKLVPHNWLRLTVTPELDDDRVNVGFEVVTVDGDRVPIASAPASLVAGEQFMQTVFRMMDDAAAKERAEPGSAGHWEAPFYYDDPDGGGVVEVIAQGDGTDSQIAYAIESPKRELADVDFVPYRGTVMVPEDWDAPPPSCQESNSTSAPNGRFNVEFVASSTVLGAELKAPLTGTVYGSVYRSADVEITGPIDGAAAQASFTFDGIDVVDGPSKRSVIDTELPAGDYQVLGFLDIDNNADPSDPGPDPGDPVFIPIGGFALECESQDITAEFALTLPEGQGQGG